MIPIEYDVIVFKEDHTYVAYCPELDISSCGQDVQQSKEMLKTAVRLFVEEAEKWEHSKIFWMNQDIRRTLPDAGYPPSLWLLN